MLGGLIGGGAGGLLFDVTSIITDGGSVSRFIGFILMGAATGAAVAFVDEIAKQNWVTVLSGPKEGRSFIITKPTTTIGRDELADIPLFGDPNVAKQHAYLVLQNNSVSVQSASGVNVSVNNSPTQSATLNDGDLLGVGRFHLRFSQKANLAVQAAASRPQRRWSEAQSTPQPTMQPYSAPQQTIVQSVATGNLTLTVVGGPHMNQKFEFEPGTIRIGREPGCQIILAQDTMVSRNHAEIMWNGSGWIIRDLGSTNGLWSNGRRITEQVLHIGDQIGIGQTILMVG
jgi:pSer/pThr/pTyr-binding forkhead associated (FHA) protein